MKQGHNDSGSAYDEESRVNMYNQERKKLNQEYQDDQETEREFGKAILENKLQKIKAAKQRKQAQSNYDIDVDVAERTRKKGLEKLITYGELKKRK